MLFRVSKTYDNFYQVLTGVMNQQFPVIGRTKHGTSVNIKSYNAMYFLAHARNFKNIEYDVDDDLVIVTTYDSKSKNKLKVKFYGAINNGDLIHGFLQSDYSNLPVENKTVVDIGASMGDTPIYFALQGAKRVIGFEPFPKNHELAQKNVRENNFADKIIIKLAACYSKKGFITIDPNFQSNADSKLTEFESGIQVPLVTLKDIIQEYNVPPRSVLKIDCEGCEDNIINTTLDSDLKNFDFIQIEYHNGYRNIVTKLENAGYEVSVTKPTATNLFRVFSQLLKKQNGKKTQISYVGYVFAIRN